MGVASQIGEYGIRSGKGTFCIDHPLDISHGLQGVIEGLFIGQSLESSKELQLATVVSDHELFQEQSPEQSGQDAYRQKEPGSTRHPTLPII